MTSSVDPTRPYFTAVGPPPAANEPLHGGLSPIQHRTGYWVPGTQRPQQQYGPEYDDPEEVYEHAVLRRPRTTRPSELEAADTASYRGPPSFLQGRYAVPPIPAGAQVVDRVDVAPEPFDAGGPTALDDADRGHGNAGPSSGLTAPDGSALPNLSADDKLRGSRVTFIGEEKEGDPDGHANSAGPSMPTAASRETLDRESFDPDAVHGADRPDGLPSYGEDFNATDNGDHAVDIHTLRQPPHESSAKWGGLSSSRGVGQANLDLVDSHVFEGGGGGGGRNDPYNNHAWQRPGEPPTSSGSTTGSVQRARQDYRRGYQYSGDVEEGGNGHGTGHGHGVGPNGRPHYPGGSMQRERGPYDDTAFVEYTYDPEHPPVGRFERPQPEVDWGTSLCGWCTQCDEDCDTCCDALCCFWCHMSRQWNKTMNGLTGISWTTVLCLAGSDFLLLGLGSAVVGCSVRQELRRRYHIDGSECEDAFTAVVCRHCALCQQFREMSQQREDPGLVCCENISEFCRPRRIYMR